LLSFTSLSVCLSVCLAVCLSVCLLLCMARNTSPVVVCGVSCCQMDTNNRSEVATKSASAASHRTATSATKQHRAVTVGKGILNKKFSGSLQQNNCFLHLKYFCIKNCSNTHPTDQQRSCISVSGSSHVRYADMRQVVQVFFTPLSQSLRLIIHLGEPLPEGTDFLFDFGALTCLFLFSFTLMMWTNGVGASTGMFVPALAVGAVGNCPALLHSFSHLFT